MANKKKGPVFRVSGLPNNQPDDQLSLSLKATIDDESAEERDPKPTVSIAIVPSCYHDDEKVALVEFHGRVPAFLSELMIDPTGDWQVDMNGTDISLDQNFYGFTQLYTPKADSPVTADVIAITGLDGHAYGSWRGKGNLGRMWLRDFLSKDLPCCRTMIYGYNSKLSSHGIDTILDYGRELMEALKKIRKSEKLRKRPLIFVAHSFGGIILAHCLVKTVQASEDDHPTMAATYKATYGMLLFGIPHKGLIIDDIQKMLAGGGDHPRSALLDQIRRNSDILAFQLVDFKNLIRDRKVVSFYETGQTRQLEYDNESKRWKRTGEFFTAVDTDSALLQLPDNMEDKIPLQADHSMMAKFDTRNQPGYTSARDKLLQFEQDAPRVVNARFSQVQNRPAPASMVPFQRDRSFVGREGHLAELRQRFEQEACQDHARVALVGLGGVGKSQIAIEYAYRLRMSTPDMWVFWVYASNAARFEQAYKDIANKIVLPGRDEPNVDILRLLSAWLSDMRNGRWLMIIDNADDNEVLSSADIRSRPNVQASDGGDDTTTLSSFIPQSENGWILVTSRDSIAAVNLVGNRASVIRIEAMAQEDAIELLRTRITIDKSSEEEARELVHTLDCIPLAITHAAAYMSVRERITISFYLELFRESEENQTSLLNSQEAKDIRRDDSMSDAVITTWQISFEQIRRTRPEAAELLSLMAMFDRHGIPESLLCNRGSRLQFEDAVMLLTTFSLIKSQSRSRVEQRAHEDLFEMHGLVQLATRTWLKTHGQVDEWQIESLRVMAKAFPSGEYETWTACKTLLPHAQKVLNYVREERDAALDWASIAYKSCGYLCSIEKHAPVAVLAKNAMMLWERLLGVEHPNTLMAMNALGIALNSLGQCKEAEAMHRRVLEVDGLEPLGTLSSIHNLGWVLLKQGKYEAAELVNRQVLHGFERALGREHPYTVKNTQDLGSVLMELGQYESAEVMCRRAIDGHEKLYGVEHPRTLICTNNLAIVLWKLSRFSEAEKLLTRVLEACERVLGKEHPITLFAMFNLADLLKSQGRTQEALSVMENLLSVARASSGSL